MKVTIIGDGGWGTAVGLLLHGYGHQIKIWGPFGDYHKEIRAAHENIRFLKGVKLPDSIEFTDDPAHAAEGAELTVLATPSNFYGDVCRRFVGLIKPDALVVSLTKGLCEATHCRMSELAESILGLKQVVVLSGPSHAEEVARNIPTTVVAACRDAVLARKVQSIFNGPLFRVYTSSDPLGVEIGGAVKNVIAIAVGCSDGLGFGDNTRAALITRGLAEIKRFGVAFGAKPATFSGLSGVGDLVVTCTSRHSRNHSVGERLGKGEKIEDILASMKMVAEGVWNSKVIRQLAEQHHVEMPITEVVYKICYEHLPVKEAVGMLLSRGVKPEE